MAIYSAVGATPASALQQVGTQAGVTTVVWAPYEDPTPSDAVATWADAVAAVRSMTTPETRILIRAVPGEDTVYIPAGSWTLNNTLIEGTVSGTNDMDSYRAYQYILDVFAEGDGNTPTRIYGCSGIKNIFFRGNTEDSNIYTAASYIQPGPAGTVDVTFNAIPSARVGEQFFVNGGGYYLVSAISEDGLTLTLMNPNVPGNASPDAVVSDESWALPDNAVFHCNNDYGPSSTFTIDNADFRSNGNYHFGSMHVGAEGNLFVNLRNVGSIRWYSLKVDGYAIIQTDGPCWLGSYALHGFGSVMVFAQPGSFIRSSQDVSSWTMYQSYIAYTPGNSDNWSGNPSSVQEALDRLAAACVAAGHTP